MATQSRLIEDLTALLKPYQISPIIRDIIINKAVEHQNVAYWAGYDRGKDDAQNPNDPL